MTNTELLEDYIRRSGLKKKFIASKLGITPYSLMKKIRNEAVFTSREIQALCDLLGITSLKEKDRIFFALVVDK